MPRTECHFCRECRPALRFLFRLQNDLSGSRPLSSKAFNRTVVSEAVQDDLVGELDVTKEGCFGPLDEVPQERRSIVQLACDPISALGQQEAVYRAFSIFARMCLVR